MQHWPIVLAQNLPSSEVYPRTGLLCPFSSATQPQTHTQNRQTLIIGLYEAPLLSPVLKSGQCRYFKLQAY